MKNAASVMNSKIVDKTERMFYIIHTEHTFLNDKIFSDFMKRKE